MSHIHNDHILQFEDELAKSIEREELTMSDSSPITLLEIAKALNIIADTLENIERRLDSDTDNTLH